jgi:hypothetical protein
MRSRFPFEVRGGPAGAPRTKPRALNVALPFARGVLTCVFDAEDEPEKLQLRRAAEIFAAAPPELACLQARLIVDITPTIGSSMPSTTPCCSKSPIPD